MVPSSPQALASSGVRVAETVAIKTPDLVEIGCDVAIHDYSIIGFPNYYSDIFQSVEERRVVIGKGSIIYPWCILFEGARLGEHVILEERTSIGSKTSIGNRTRIVYQAQVNDNVEIGEDCVIGGFVADNCKIGSACSVFGALVHTYSQATPKTWDQFDETGPTLEDGVTVGWGAVLVGAITIGEGAKIQPNALVTRDVAAYETYKSRH